MVVTLPLTAKPQALKSLKYPLLGSSFPLSSVKCSFPVSDLNGKLQFAGSRSALPVIRAQSCQGYTPDVQFYKIEAILRPWRVAHVSSGLLKIGIRGVTVSDVRGFGSQGGSMERHGGSEFSEDSFVAKVKMEIVVSKDQTLCTDSDGEYLSTEFQAFLASKGIIHQWSCPATPQQNGVAERKNRHLLDMVEEVVDKIIVEARTGEIGDGKIFLIPVSDVIRIRTGERGEKAERMRGGRADMISTTTTN